MRERSACIIIDHHQHAVLLMHRIRDRREYYTLPGGKIEPGESPEAACFREAREETGLQVKIGEEVRVLLNLGRVEHYFSTTSFTGRVSLGGPERERNSPENFYQPLWVPLDQLGEILLLPDEVLEMVDSLT